MGSLGFDDFKERLKLRAGNRSDLETAGDSSLNYYGIWTNLAYRQLCTQDNILGIRRKIIFPQLMTSATDTTVDGTAYVDVPSDCLYVSEVFDTSNGRKLDWIPWKKYIGYTDRTTAASEGDPTEWHHRGSYIYLHPTPGTTGDTITIYYNILVTDLSGSATTDIGAEWDEPIIELASYKMFTWLHEHDKAKVCRESFLEMASGLADIYYNERKDTAETWQPSNSYMGR
jgi:hypothetical protein